MSQEEAIQKIHEITEFFNKRFEKFYKKDDQDIDG